MSCSIATKANGLADALSRADWQRYADEHAAYRSLPWLYTAVTPSVTTERAPHAQPITERANELTDDIDRCTEPSLVRIMRAIDGQIFYGYRQYPALNDPEVRAPRLPATTARARVLARTVRGRNRVPGVEGSAPARVSWDDAETLPYT